MSKADDFENICRPYTFKINTAFYAQVTRNGGLEIYRTAGEYAMHIPTQIDIAAFARWLLGMFSETGS